MVLAYSPIDPHVNDSLNSFCALSCVMTRIGSFSSLTFTKSASASSPNGSNVLTSTPQYSIPLQPTGHHSTHHVELASPVETGPVNWRSADCVYAPESA